MRLSRVLQRGHAAHILVERVEKATDNSSASSLCMPWLTPILRASARRWPRRFPTPLRAGPTTITRLGPPKQHREGDQGRMRLANHTRQPCRGQHAALSGPKNGYQHEHCGSFAVRTPHRSGSLLPPTKPQSHRLLSRGIRCLAKASRRARHVCRASRCEPCLIKRDGATTQITARAISPAEAVR
jgi:hypothetical protein